MSEQQLIQTPCVFGENGNFLLERELGRGGMGGVYMGRDKMLDRPVAVKVMLKEYGSDPEFVEKFKREAQAAARLIHPNIAQIYSYGISEGMPYIAMELVAGGSLDQLMRNFGDKIDVPRVMKICEQVAQALRCAADQGLVHGDVKPENVLLDANGNAKLVDFGLAAMQKNTNEIWGTPYYIAPEKVKKEPVDYRADMYSLGGTIYHALTGTAPFEGDDAAAVVRKRFEGPAAKPSEVRQGLSPQIDFLVMKMLALDPADRYPSFEALLADFKKVMTTGLASSAQSLTPAQAAAAGATASGGTGRISTTVGGKKLVLKPRKKFKISSEDSDEASSDEDSDEVADLPEDVDADGGEGASSGRRRSMRNFNKRRLANGDDGENYDDDDEGGVGGKVALVIGGVVAAILIVVGGLFALKYMNESGNAAEGQAQIELNIKNAKASLQNTLSVANDFNEKITAMADELHKDCLKVHRDTAQALSEAAFPENIIAMLNVPKPAELVAAEKALQAPPKQAPEAPAAAAPASGQNAAAKAAGQAMEQMSVAMGGAMNDAMMAQLASKMGEIISAVESGDVAGLMAKMPDEDYRKMVSAAAAAGFKFREPKGDEADPNSPEGQKYREDQCKWLVEQAMKSQSAVAESGGKPAAATASAGGQKKTIEVPSVVSTVQDLWLKTYAAEAAALRIRKQLLDLAADIETAIVVRELTKPEMDRIAKATNDLKARFDEIKGSADVTALQKAKGTVKDRGEKALKRTLKKIKDDKLAAEREAARIQREKEEEERKKRQAEERAQLVEKESAAAKAKFDAICAAGNFRQLDWSGAKRQLNALKDTFSTPEGELRVNDEIRKVDMMASVQTILQRNMKGYVFVKATPKAADPSEQKPHLRGMEVVDVDDKQIVVMKKSTTATVQKQKKIPWQTFYRDYHANMGELCNKFIRRGRENGTPTLNAREQADALFGIALTMQIVCADDASAASFGDTMAKEALKVFPSYTDYAKQLFPNIDFSEVEKAAAAENL